jgi:RNA polymerase sigma-70 factor (ECF subfamily)
MTQEQKIEQQVLLTRAWYDFEKILNKHSFFKVHNQMLSEDLVQDTFIKTWNYLVRGGKIETMKAFLYHVLNDLIVDHYRKKKPVSLDALLENGFEPRDENDERIVNIIDGKKAVSLIERLPEKYKRTIHMKYIQNLSLKEMSIITGQTKSTLAVHVHRGLEKLKVIYSHA